MNKQRVHRTAMAIAEVRMCLPQRLPKLQRRSPTDPRVERLLQRPTAAFQARCAHPERSPCSASALDFASITMNPDRTLNRLPCRLTIGATSPVFISSHNAGGFAGRYTVDCSVSLHTYPDRRRAQQDRDRLHRLNPV
jgi:hypothetical protein